MTACFGPLRDDRRGKDVNVMRPDAKPVPANLGTLSFFFNASRGMDGGPFISPSHNTIAYHLPRPLGRKKRNWGQFCPLNGFTQVHYIIC